MRAAVFTLTTVTLGTAAHVLAGGAVGSRWVLVFLACGIGVCAQALCASEVGLAGLCAGVGVTQLAVHLVLMQGSSMPGMSATPTMPAETLTMVGAHLAAAVAVGLLLRRAEAGVCALLRILALLLPRVRVLTAPTVGTLSRTWIPGLDGVPRGLLLASGYGRRAPPQSV